MKNFMPKSPILGSVLGLLVWCIVMIPVHFIDIPNLNKLILVGYEFAVILLILIIHYREQDY